MLKQRYDGTLHACWLGYAHVNSNATLFWSFRPLWVHNATVEIRETVYEHIQKHYCITEQDQT